MKKIAIAVLLLSGCATQQTGYRDAIDSFQKRREPSPYLRGVFQAVVELQNLLAQQDKLKALSDQVEALKKPEPIWRDPRNPATLKAQ